MFRLTNSSDAEDARRRIEEILAARREWLVAFAAQKSPTHFRLPSILSLTSDELELHITHGNLILSLPVGASPRLWRVAAWEERDGKLHLAVSRRVGAESAMLEFVPRASAREAAEAVREARQVRCLELAQTAKRAVEIAFENRATIERAHLSAGARRGEPGRYARILLRSARGDAAQIIAATGAVVEINAGSIENFLASALLWFARVVEKFSARKKRAAVSALWLIVPPSLAAELAAHVALLRAGLREAITVCALDEERQTLIEEMPPLVFSRVPDLNELLDAERAPRLSSASRLALSKTSARLRELAPEAIDIVRARRGETLRFRGLPFARVRKMAGEEKVWFGIGARRQILSDENWTEFVKLLDDLNEHRRVEKAARDAKNFAAFDVEAKSFDVGANLTFDFADESNKDESSRLSTSNSSGFQSNDSSNIASHHHALYASAPEAWLEFLLRQDVSKLDAGLRLAPLHAQFRAANEKRGARPVDLLALRRDGRLVVIELKTTESLTLPLQGADYWRRIEAHRRAGNIQRARLFDDAEIADAPPLVYLVAPMLHFHRSFAELARMVDPSIEIYRFDINEDWRTGVRVIRRERVN
jgi:hypothetical protein